MNAFFVVDSDSSGVVNSAFVSDTPTSKSAALDEEVDNDGIPVTEVCPSHH